MSTLNRMLMSQFLKVFAVALLLFVVILSFVDIFSHLYSYIASDIKVTQILKINLYYLPKCIHYSLPIATLFAVSYTLGNFYANNELIAVFSSGVPLHKFVVPILLFGFIGSLFNFAFEELVVIDSLKKKNDEYNEVMYFGRTRSADNNRAAVYDIEKNIIYYATSYRDELQILSDLTLLELTADGLFKYRFDAREARWKEDRWIFSEVRFFTYEENIIKESFIPILDDKKYNKAPKFFRDITRNMEELRLIPAIRWLQELDESNLYKKYRSALIEFYKRFSFTFTTFIVALLSSALGSRFNKNILLYSLLISICVAVVYYVFQMMSELFASSRVLSPFIGSWLPFFTFLFIGRYLFKKART